MSKRLDVYLFQRSERKEKKKKEEKEENNKRNGSEKIDVSLWSRCISLAVMVLKEEQL